MTKAHLDRESIVGLLRSHEINPSHQRIEIAHVLFSRCEHLSADRILAIVNDRHSETSKATVYNTLKAFSRAGIIQEVAVDPSRLVYDSTTTRHHHFLDEDTGELTGINPAQVELPRLPPLPEGTHATSVELIIRVRRR